MNLENEIEENSVEGVMLHYRIIKNASRGKNDNNDEELPPSAAADSDVRIANR